MSRLPNSAIAASAIQARSCTACLSRLHDCIPGVRVAVTGLTLMCGPGHSATVTSRGIFWWGMGACRGERSQISKREWVER